MAKGTIQVDVKRSYVSKNGTVTDDQGTIYVNQEIAIEQKIDANAVNAEFSVTCAAANIRSIGIGCKGAAEGLTIKTNSTSSPGNTINVKPGNGIVWIEGDPSASKPISVDLTKIYVTNNNSTTEQTLQFYLGLDATPNITEIP